MPLPRRRFIQQGTLASVAGLAAPHLLSRLSAASAPITPIPPLAPLSPINRQALVNRHDVRVTSLDPSSPLTVGDGDFAFTVDPTGLQSFEDLFHDKGIPLETRSTWACFDFPQMWTISIRGLHHPLLIPAARSISPISNPVLPENIFAKIRIPFPLGKSAFSIKVNRSRPRKRHGHRNQRLDQRGPGRHHQQLHTSTVMVVPGQEPSPSPGKAALP